MINKETIDGETENKQGFTYKGCGDILRDVIYVGDNFTINAKEGNSKGS